jgi:hypothetical protein
MEPSREKLSAAVVLLLTLLVMVAGTYVCAVCVLDQLNWYHCCTNSPIIGERSRLAGCCLTFAASRLLVQRCVRFRHATAWRGAPGYRGLCACVRTTARSGAGRRARATPAASASSPPPRLTEFAATASSLVTRRTDDRPEIRERWCWPWVINHGVITLYMSWCWIITTAVFNLRNCCCCLCCLYPQTLLCFTKSECRVVLTLLVHLFCYIYIYKIIYLDT